MGSCMLSAFPAGTTSSRIKFWVLVVPPFPPPIVQDAAVKAAGMGLLMLLLVIEAVLEVRHHLLRSCARGELRVHGPRCTQCSHWIHARLLTAQLKPMEAFAALSAALVGAVVVAFFMVLRVGTLYAVPLLSPPRHGT